MVTTRTKVFTWDDNVTGDCHEKDATLVLEATGNATFHSRVRTVADVPKALKTNLTLLRADGTNSQTTGLYSSPMTSPGLQYVEFNFAFPFDPLDFDKIKAALIHSEC
jgi:hypothetical protein